MRSGLLRFVVFFYIIACVITIGCAPNSGDTAINTPVLFNTAFTDLASVDIYDEEGDFLQTVDDSVDFQEALPFGVYYVDFIDANGNHAFMDDGRPAFAPMGEGFTPIDGPFEINGQNMWQIAVDPVLEANARLTIRAADGDETLQPYKHLFPNWQMNLPEGEKDLVENDGWLAEGKAYSTSYGSTSSRLAVTWQLSYAMTGSSTSACYSSTSCWTMSSTASGTTSVYSYWPYFVSDNDSAWTTAVNVYGSTSGNISCRDNPTASGYCRSWSGSTCTAYYTCGVTYGSAYPGTPNADDYACQTTSGVCGYGPYRYVWGGECKFFQNFVLYASGAYRSSSGGFRTLPSDSTITSYSSSGTSAPTTSTSNIAIGDALRRLSPVHSVTVVAYDSANQRAIVVDSNMKGSTSTTFNERIAAGVFGFSTAYSGYYLLSNYRNLKCVYASSPCGS